MYSKNRKIIYFFTKEKNTIIASIIPAFPLVFITGYLYLLYFKGNVQIYTKNIICTFSLDVIFMILLYLLICSTFCVCNKSILLGSI